MQKETIEDSAAAPTAGMELRSQEGMEQALIRFAQLLKEGPEDCMNATFPPEFIRASFEESTMVYRYETEPGMSNPLGKLHGGMIAAMMDTTMGALSFYMAGEKLTPTITMKVDYVRPGIIGQPVYVGVRCTNCGRTMCYVTGKAWQEDENYPFTTADGVYFAGGHG